MRQIPRRGFELYGRVNCKRSNPQWLKQYRQIATHTFNHHASALSVIPTEVDTLSKDFKENAIQFEEVMGRMRELHQKIEAGGSLKAREKHVARGKMLPREYVTALCHSRTNSNILVAVLQP